MVVELVEGAAYHSLRLLGKGSFGSAYRAMRGATQVVLKIQQGGNAGYACYQEAEALKKIRDANIVSIFQAFRIKVPEAMAMEKISVPALFLIEMEYCDRGDAEAVVKHYEPEPIPTALAYDMAHMMCMGCHALHLEHLVHLDLKPANLLLCMVGNRGVLKIADFGLAVSEGSLGPTGGTKFFMAPEQAADPGVRITHRLGGADPEFTFVESLIEVLRVMPFLSIILFCYALFRSGLTCGPCQSSSPSGHVALLRISMLLLESLVLGLVRLSFVISSS